SAAQRTVSFALTDGAGNTSNPAFKKINVLAAGAAAASPPLRGTVEGVDFEESARLHGGFYFTPPWTRGAVGPNHPVRVAGSVIQFPTKEGVQRASLKLGKPEDGLAAGSFSAGLTAANRLDYGSAVYDTFNNRFLVLAVEVVGGATATSRLLIGVSDD